MTDLLIHRGIVNKNYKENLLKSFKQSFKKGYGIETDIHATKDDKFICCLLYTSPSPRDVEESRMACCG